MTLENLLLLVSILFLVVYAMRHREELAKRTGILCVGSGVCYVLLYLLLFPGRGFSIYLISNSMLLFTALDHLYFSTVGVKKKKEN